MTIEYVFGIIKTKTNYIKNMPKGIKGFQKGHRPWNFSLTQFTDERIKKIADNKRGGHHSPTTEFKKGHKPYLIMGEKNPNWKDGICKENYKQRRSERFKKWREKVFKRDDYTCWICGEIGKILHPHHLKEFSIYPELRFEINNGLTLCEFCHKAYTNFGRNGKQIVPMNIIR